MLREDSITLENAPALVMRGTSSERGTVLLLHGFGASRESQRTEARSLAQHGYLAVTIDAIGHGARRYADFDQRFSADRAEASYFETVRHTSDELPAIVAAMHRKGLARPGRLGACGISMGGAVLFGAIPSVRFDAVATIVATPIWRGSAQSPHARPQTFFPTPLLVQTGGADPVVAAADARTFCDALTPLYARDPDRLRYLEFVGEKHAFSEAKWNRAWSEVLAWFDRFLGR